MVHWFGFENIWGILFLLLLIFIFHLILDCIKLQTTTPINDDTVDTDDDDDDDNDDSDNTVTLEMYKDQYNCFVDEMNSLKTLIENIIDDDDTSNPIEINKDDIESLKDKNIETKKLIVDSLVE